MTQSSRVPDRTIDPKTGFLESNAYIQAFNADKKQAFISLFKDNGLKLYRTCAELGVKADTVHKHYDIDPAFHEAVEDAKRQYFDELEGVSRINAMNPRSVIERIFQLKARFPERYGDGKRDLSNNQIIINFDQKTLEIVKKRDQILEADMITSTQPLARESITLSADHDPKSHNPDHSVEQLDHQPLSP